MISISDINSTQRVPSIIFGFFILILWIGAKHLVVQASGFLDFFFSVDFYSLLTCNFIQLIASI